MLLGTLDTVILSPHPSVPSSCIQKPGWSDNDAHSTKKQDCLTARTERDDS